MAADEICLHEALEGIKILVSEAGGKILAEDLNIISRLQESFREVVKANCSEESDFIEDVLSHLITKTDYIFLTAKSAILASIATEITKLEVLLKVPRSFEPIKKVEDHLNEMNNEFIPSYKIKGKISYISSTFRKSDHTPILFNLDLKTFTVLRREAYTPDLLLSLKL